MKTRSLNSKISRATLLVIMLMAGALMYVMNFFMNSLTDTIMLSMMQPLAKTAAQSLEGSLRNLADRLFLIRDHTVRSFDGANPEILREALDRESSGIEFVWLGIYEADGTLLAGSEDCPLSIAGRPLFRAIVQSGRLTIEDTSIGGEGPEIAMGLPISGVTPAAGKTLVPGNAAPVGAAGRAGEARLSPEGTDDEKTAGLKGILVGAYKYDIIGDVLGNINIGTHGSAFIVNGGGELIGHRDLGKVFSREPALLTFGDSPATRAALLAMKQGRTGSAEITTAGAGQVFVSYSPIRGTRWSIGIRAPRGDFLGAARQALLAGAFITVLALVASALALGIFFRNTLSIPLKAIAGQADKLARGRFDSVLPVNLTMRHDEIGRLGAAFSQMSDSIHALIQDIDRLTAAARAGELTQRAGREGREGDYGRIMDGMNGMLDIICSHLDSMPDGLLLFGKERNPLYMNRALRKMLAYHEYQADDPLLLAKMLAPLHSEDLTRGVERLFLPDAEDGDFCKAEVAVKDVSGAERNYSLNFGRVGGGPGSGAGADGDEASWCVMLVATDVTMLTRARIDAEAASRAKGDFLSRMSHEMRTPMNAIIGMAAIGKSSPDADRKEYCLDKISEASRHLLGVINDILDMSKIEADKFELSASEFNFEAMLRRVVNVVNFRVEEKSQNLFIEIGGGIPKHMVADEQRLAQVLTNLLANAVKFTPEKGSITLSASLLADLDDSCALRISVSDTGIGISEEQRARLFRSFEQADGGIARKFGGTGLGLAISKRIIEMMGGDIRVESEPGRGSSFIIELDVPRGEIREQVILPEIDWKKLRFLVVDDAPEILHYFESLLLPTGAACVTAPSGERALELLRESAGRAYEAAFDLIFVDLRMPGMDGIELTRRIMEQPGKKPAVIMISAAERADMEQEALAAGVTRFLQKPLFPSAVIDGISECLSRRRTPGPESGHPPGRENGKGDGKDNGKGESGEGVFAGKRVLLAEDVEINREIAQALLEHTGLEMAFAADGGEAVEKFSAAPAAYDLILMDVHMPLVDGYEATRRIRGSGLPGAAVIPIVAMTANVFREDVERCLAAGMNAHLGKPIDADEVIAVLKNYLQKR